MTYKFSTIRRAYEDIMADLSSFEDDIQLDDKLAEDLGLWGDDNAYLLEEVIEKYSLDYSDFDYLKHFEGEGELITLEAILLAPFRVIGLITWYIYERAFPVTCDQPKWLEPKTDNPRLDLTVGDLMAWRLAGRFCLREEADIRVA